MKVRCPGCSKEYRAPVLAPGQAATVRCRACGSTFRVGAPPPAAPAPKPPSPPQAGPGPPQAGGTGADLVFSVRASSDPQAPAAPGAGPAPRGASVLIADEARPFREVLQRAVHDLGQSCELAEDGESALVYVQQKHPRLLLVNVYLRKMLGIVVCERIKADPGLRSTKVVLIGSLFRKDRFVRGPEHLYGADGYIEEAISPEELKQRLAVLLGGAALGAQQPAAAARAPAAAGAPSEPTPDATDISVPEDLQRLIRIILSDIGLYNPDRLQASIASGEFMQEFKVELDEGRKLVLERFPDLAQVEGAYELAVQQWLEERRKAPAS